MTKCTGNYSKNSTRTTLLSAEQWKGVKRMKDPIERQDAIARAVPLNLFGREVMMVSVSELENLPSAQPEQRYTEEELRVFQHGISLSLLSKRSSQHWQYDEDTATEIKFLERLYEKVGADMRGDEDE